MAQAAADAAADGGGSDDDDDASVSTMDSVDARALDDLEVSCRGYNGLLVLYFFLSALSIFVSCCTFPFI